MGQAIRAALIAAPGPDTYRVNICGFLDTCCNTPLHCFMCASLHCRKA
jgi:hypothetical protein